MKWGHRRGSSRWAGVRFELKDEGKILNYIKPEDEYKELYAVADVIFSSGKSFCEVEILGPEDCDGNIFLQSFRCQTDSDPLPTASEFEVGGHEIWCISELGRVVISSLVAYDTFRKIRNMFTVFGEGWNAFSNPWGAFLHSPKPWSMWNFVDGMEVNARREEKTEDAPVATKAWLYSKNHTDTMVLLLEGLKQLSKIVRDFITHYSFFFFIFLSGSPLVHL